MSQRGGGQRCLRMWCEEPGRASAVQFVRPTAGRAGLALDPIDASLEQQRQRVQRLLGEADAGRCGGGRRGATASSVAPASASSPHGSNASRSPRKRPAVSAREREQLDALVGPLAAAPAAASWQDRVWEQTPRAGRPTAAAADRRGERARSSRRRRGSARADPRARTGLGPSSSAWGESSRQALRDRRDARVACDRELAGGHVRFHVHDPIGMGASLAGFAAFAAGRTTHGRPSTDAAQLRGVVERLRRARQPPSRATTCVAERDDATDFLGVAGHGEVAHARSRAARPSAMRSIATSPDQLARLTATAASRGVMIIAHDADGELALPGGDRRARRWPRQHWRQLAAARGGLSARSAPTAALVAAVAARRPSPSPPLPFATPVGDEPRWSRNSGEGLAAPARPQRRRPRRAAVRRRHPARTGGGRHRPRASRTCCGLHLRLSRGGTEPDQLQLYLLDWARASSSASSRRRARSHLPATRARRLDELGAASSASRCWNISRE